MENILKSVNASLSTINSTLFQELISVGTDFESKVSVGIKNNLSDFPYSRWKMLNYLLSGTDFLGIMKHDSCLETNKFLMKKEKKTSLFGRRTIWLFQKRDKGGEVVIIVKEPQLLFRAHWTPPRDYHYALYKYKVNKYNYVVDNFLCQVIFLFLFLISIVTYPYPKKKEKRKLPEIKN